MNFIDILQSALFDKKILQDVIDNIEYNKEILKHYYRFKYDVPVDYFKTVKNKTESLDYCNKFWLIDKYEVQKIKDVKKQNLCKDKFCGNCKKVKQSARMAKYLPELEQYKNKLYHLTLTQPNVDGESLEDTIKHMAKCFRRLVKIIRNEYSINGLDFIQWEYEGAVRSLEVTFKDDEYHPHYHVGLVLKSDLLGRKTIVNTFSYDYRNGIPELKRLFSEQEVLIQKIWYLLINKQKVTKANIDALEQGYSSTMDKFPEEEYAELFKYMTKIKDQEGNIISYDHFRTLYWALYRVKQIQGYGCLYRITDDIDLEEYEALYTKLIDDIKKKESPAEVLEKPQELILDTQYKIISRKSYFKYLRTL